MITIVIVVNIPSETNLPPAFPWLQVKLLSEITHCSTTKFTSPLSITEWVYCVASTSSCVTGSTFGGWRSSCKRHVAKYFVSECEAPGTKPVNFAGSVVGPDCNGEVPCESVVSGPGPAEAGIAMLCL